MRNPLPLLPDRRSGEDRRLKPGAGYGIKASSDPTNRRIEQRRSWKKNRGRVDWARLRREVDEEIGELFPFDPERNEVI